MNENLERAAKECADSFHFVAFYTESEMKAVLRKTFEDGAQWQKTQKPDLQKFWEQSIQLDGLYTFDEAQKKCPKGYRMPTFTEWAWLIDNTEYSFNKKKKEGVFRFADGAKIRLPAAGYRNNIFNTSYNQGTYGNYWSSSPSGTYAWRVYFNGSTVNVNTYGRVYAFSVRCLPIEIK